MIDNSKLGFAVVGCGRIATRHMQHIKNAGELVAACDIDQFRAEAYVQDSNVPAFSSVQSMLEARSDCIDVVSVCSPNGLHAEHSVAALRAGCHVLCEKPMALTTAECGEMIQAAEHANRRLFVVKQNRFNPPVRAVKAALDEGKLGRIFSVALNCFWNRNDDYYLNDPWKGTRTLDGGCLFTQFSHFVDLLYWMVGDVADVRAFTDNFCHKEAVEFEDCGVVALKFRSGAVGTMNFTINSCKKNMEGSLTIFAENGTVKIGGQYLNELEYQCIKGQEISGLPKGKPPNQYGHYVGSMSNHDEVYKNVRKVLEGDGVISANGFEGMKTVEIIERIYQAI